MNLLDDPEMVADLRRVLLLWYRKNKRPLAWRKNKEPYAIWVSEIMLQQTRVDQMDAYFRRFLDRFPTLGDLARASEEQVLKAWEGLGYYARARNMCRAAQQVAKEREGVLPDTYEEAAGSSGHRAVHRSRCQQYCVRSAPSRVGWQRHTGPLSRAPHRR